METQKSDIQAAIDAGRELGIKFEVVNGTPLAIVPDGFRTVELTHLRERPQHIQTTIQHTTADSFIRYYKEFATQDSIILLDTAKNSFLAKFDYHGNDHVPGWCMHNSAFQLKKTPEWEAWETNNKKLMTQADFGAFIENNLLEIVSPPNGQMLEIALSLQAKTNISFSKAIRLDNGETQFQYQEKIEGTAGAGGAMKIPDLFSIGLVLFEGAAPYQMDARFRFRIKEGNLTLWYELVRPHKTIDANIADTRKLIEDNMLLGHFFEARFA